MSSFLQVDEFTKSTNGRIHYYKRKNSPSPQVDEFITTNGRIIPRDASKSSSPQAEEFPTTSISGQVDYYVHKWMNMLSPQVDEVITKSISG